MSLTYEELWNEISSGQVLTVDSEFAEDLSQPDSPKNETDSDDYEDSSSNEEDSYFVIDSDPIERYADIILDHGEVATALESAFNEALAYFNKFESNESHIDEQVLPRVFRKKGRRDEGFINEIDNFWEGWVDGLDETSTLPKPETKTHRLKDHKKIAKSSPSKSSGSSASDDIVDIFAFDSFTSAEIEIDVESEIYLPPVLPVPTVKPTDLLLPVITVKEEKLKPEPIIVEVFEEKETKVKRKPSQRKSPKNKKRKASSSESDEESGEETATKKTKTKKTQNIFKREEVLKIENDGEDEDIDIGDLNDCQ